MKRLISIIWCFVSTPLSFFFGWGGGFTSTDDSSTTLIGLIAAFFLFLCAVLLLFRKINVGKIIGFIGCGVNFINFVFICAASKAGAVHNLEFFIWVIGEYCLIALLPLFLLLRLKNGGSS